MDLADCYRQANGDAQAACQLERLPVATIKDPIHWLAARVPKYEDRPPFVTSERERLGRPRGIKFRCERVFVLELPEARGRQHQDRQRVAALPAAVRDELPAFLQRLQNVSGKFRHEPINTPLATRLVLWRPI
jgi:hypothetical protein